MALSKQAWDVIRAMRDGHALIATRVQAKRGEGEVMTIGQAGDVKASASVFETLRAGGYIEHAKGNQWGLTDLGREAQHKGAGRASATPKKFWQVYLGVPSVHDKIAARLDEIAAEFGGRGAMMRAIAEGRLKVVEADE